MTQSTESTTIVRYFEKILYIFLLDWSFMSDKVISRQLKQVKYTQAGE